MSEKGCKFRLFRLFTGIALSVPNVPFIQAAVPEVAAATAMDQLWSVDDAEREDEFSVVGAAEESDYELVSHTASEDADADADRQSLPCTEGTYARCSDCCKWHPTNQLFHCSH